MAYHVQAEIRNGNTIYVGWYEIKDFLTGKFEEGFTLAAVWPNVILMDKAGVGGDIRSITDDDIAQGYRAKIKALR